ncbi:hypothetical protein BIFDEN_01475 [Bifidobacterium dentium ATCC 27678]|nr:hypothetical protein BIFDEN_01475 [Bifidobacterium dentium ATCC 27678]
MMVILTKIGIRNAGTAIWKIDNAYTPPQSADAEGPPPSVD